MSRDGRALEWTRRGRIARGAALALSALLLPPAVRAQGFGVYEQGACATGRAGAGVAAPCGDGSSVFFNPAGVAEARSLTLGLGALGVYPDGGFTADGTGRTTRMGDDAIPMGHAYAVFPVWDRFSGGVGIYAPYGLKTTWPTEFEGRFVGYDNKLQTLYFQTSLGARIDDRVSFGVGPVVVLSSVELNRRLDLSRQPVPAELGAVGDFGDLGVPTGTDFVDGTVDSDEAVGHGLAAGILVRLHRKVRVGARYLSSVTMDYEGFAGFTPVETDLELPPDNPLGLPGGASVDSLLEASGIFLTGGPFSGQEVRASLTLPAQVVVGVSVEPLEGLLLAADYQWTRWSDVDRVLLDFENEATPDDELALDYRDTGSFRLGAEYGLLTTLTLRSGYVHNEEASPATSVTPILPEGVRNHVTAGLGWDATDQIRLDVAYQAVFQEDRRGRVRNPAPGGDPTPELNEGEYRFQGHLLSATLSWRFR